MWTPDVDVDALRRRQFVGWEGICAHAVFQDPDVVERQSRAYQRSFSTRMKEAMDMITCECMITWVARPFTYPRTDNADFVNAIAYALTHEDWMDVAAALCRNMVDVRSLAKEETLEFLGEIIFEYPVRRPFMQLVWTNVAYYYWEKRDRASLRKLVEAGVILPQNVLDMLFYARDEEHKLPVMKATAAVFAQAHGGIMDADALVKAKEVIATVDVTKSDDRMFCCTVRCAMMKELIDTVNFNPYVWYDEDDIDDEEKDPLDRQDMYMFSQVIEDIFKFVNFSFLVFLFKEMGRSFVLDLCNERWGHTCVNYPSPYLTERWVYSMYSAATLSAYNTNDDMFPGWVVLFFGELFGPHGVLACLAREMNTDAFLRLLHIDLGLEMDTTKCFVRQYCYREIRSMIQQQRSFGWETVLTYVFHERLTAHMQRVVAAPSEEERRAIVFDYEFSNWDPMTVIHDGKWEAHVGDVLARCDFTSEADGGNVDLWFDEWKTTVGALNREKTVPRALARLFDPRWAQEKLASRKRALESV